MAQRANRLKLLSVTTFKDLVTFKAAPSKEADVSVADVAVGSVSQLLAIRAAEADVRPGYAAFCIVKT